MQVLLNSDHRFTCLACGRCCRTTSISLTPAEAKRLATLRPPDGKFPTIQPYMGREGLACRILPRSDGSCPYLRQDNLCAIHAEEGEERKPLACRLFPFSFLRTPKGLAVPLRFSCPAVACGAGEPLKGREGDLGKLAKALGDVVGIRSVGETVPFDGLRSVTFADAEKILEHQLVLLDSGALPRLARTAAAVEFLDLVASSSVEADSRHRYWEGIRDGLLARLSAAPPTARVAPGGLDRLFFRQTAYGLAGVFSPGWLRKGLLENISRRFRRLLGGIAYTLGWGSLGHASCHTAVDAVLAQAEGEDREPFEPLHRFFRHHLATFACFTDPSPSPTLWDGLHTLGLALPCGIWFARAASRNRPPTFRDGVEGAVRLADALSVPAAWSKFERGLSGWVFQRRRAWEKLAVWAAGLEPGEPLDFPPGDTGEGKAPK